MAATSAQIIAMAQMGFKPVDPKSSAIKRLIVNITGKEKSGKSNLALTAPGPIALFDFDYGLEGVVEKFAGKKSIYRSEYRISELSADKYISEWERHKKEFRAALSHKGVRTVVEDTGTEMWELVRLARFGKLTQVMPQHYGPVNAELRGLVRDAYSSDKNLIFLHKMTQVYINNQPTKDYAMAGFKDIPYAVQVNCLAWREEGGGDFHLEIQDCRQNSAIAGMDLVGDMINFPQLAMMVYPDTEEDNWV